MRNAILRAEHLVHERRPSLPSGPSLPQISHHFPSLILQLLFPITHFSSSQLGGRSLGLMRVLALLWAAAALALPLSPAGEHPAQLVLHGKPVHRVEPPVLEHIPTSFSQVPSPPLPSPHVQPPAPPPNHPHRLPPEQRLPTKQRLPPEYDQPDRDRSVSDAGDTDNRTESDANETDVSLCITLAGLAALAGDAPEQGEVRLCMGADTSPARWAYTRLAKWAARHPAWTHPMDLARAWTAIVRQALVDTA
ncbi:unnamed protein product [Cutaneotrichosporon oleaginosum]